MLLVLTQSKSIGRVIDVYFFIIFLILNNKSYIFCYCILNYDDNLIFDIFFLYVIYHHFSHKFRISDLFSFLSQFFKAFKELY